jgi:protein-disulfide isomerase
VPITLTYQGQSETGTVFASKDGKYVVRGEIFSTSEDPFATNRATLSLENSPSLGPANAKVTLVEFSDFQCPHCRLFQQALKALLPKFPQVRVVYKNFPLENIHPWAMMAAMGSRCAYQNSNAAFWKMYDSIFDQQDVISAENVYDKLTDFAGAVGISADAFHSCLNDPATKQAVEADLQLGEKLDINSTPTVFINGRRVVGGDPASLEQLLTFELNRK